MNYNTQNNTTDTTTLTFATIDTSSFSQKQEILQLERAWSKAYEDKDVKTLNTLIADDFVGIESYGKFLSKAETISDVETGADDVQSDIPKDLQVRIYSNTAIVTGKLTLKGTKKTGGYSLHLLFTDVWIKRAEGWRVVSYQATRLPMK